MKRRDYAKEIDGRGIYTVMKIILKRKSSLYARQKKKNADC